MKENISFLEWLGVPPEQKFGFSSKFGKIVPKDVEENEKRPIHMLEVSNILDELTWLGPINNKKPERLFENVVNYGQESDKMQVVVSPLGSLKIIIRKIANTLEGAHVPICYSIYPLINDYNRTSPDDHHIENTLANKIADKLTEIDNRLMLSGLRDYKNLRELTVEMARHVRSNHPSCMHYQGVVQNGEFDYTIYLQYNGQGVEAPSARRVEQFDIHVQYSKDTGLIRCWGNEISSPTSQHLWQVQPSEWDEYFSPKQKNHEIIECIMNALYTY